MSITVIICTYNRSQKLAKALESIAASVVPNDVEWNVLVVDNNSSDQTREVVEDFSKRFKDRFRYHFEPRPGKSYALNSGIGESSGDVLAFTDDDVIVESNWLWNLTASLLSCEWAGTAGRITPLWEQPIPRWLRLDGDLLRGPFVVFDLGPTPCPLLEAPVGANMAYRKEIFAKYGGFLSDLGPQPGSEIRGEDSEFGYRLLKSGEQLRYEPSAVVYHPVPSERINRKFLLAWFFSHGYEQILMLGNPSEAKWYFGGIPVVLFRRFGRWSAQWLVTFRPARRFQCKLNLWNMAGEIRASYELSRRLPISDSALPISRITRSTKTKTGRAARADENPSSF